MKKREGEPRSISRTPTSYTPEAEDALREAAADLGVTFNRAANIAAIVLRDLVKSGLESTTGLVIVNTETLEPQGEVTLIDTSGETTPSESNIIPLFPRS